MRPIGIAQSLKLLWGIQQPAFVWGPPGVGKSQVVKQTATEVGLDIIDVRAVLLDPVDLRGIPSAYNGKAKWLTPDFLPTGGDGVLFLDELNAAPQLVQAACLQLVLDRRLGEYVLPAGWHVVAAGNRETDRSVAQRMPLALANRFVHLDFEIHMEDWLVWAYGHAVHEAVTSFIRFRPALLHEFDTRKNEKAYPTPRSWEFTSKILTATPHDDVLYDLVKGTVGEGAAAELTGFMRTYRNLPDVDEILAKPKKAPVPKDLSTLYALCGVLCRRMALPTVDPLVTYYGRLPAEFSIIAMKDSLRVCPSIMGTDTFKGWAKDHASYLF